MQTAIHSEHQTRESRAGSYMTFSAGSAHFSLLVGHIRYIASRDSIRVRVTPNQSGPSHQVFEFEGQPIVLYKFNKLVGASSLVDESAELIELLRQRKQDHIDWIEALENSIRTAEEFKKATDPHKCAFGMWYDRYVPADEELKAIMVQFNEPHCRIHSLAETLLKIAQSGHVDRAIALLNEERYSTLKQLLSLFGQAEARLQDMVKPVVMIVDLGHWQYALELDNIEDIHEFNDQHWLQDSPHNLEHKHCYDGFFQKENGKLFIKLDPSALVPKVDPQL